ncbi:hypothetical protein K490DRAFT_56528 [Saccharata proteae CBS 121410]|uniref:SH3 domain-containing protein n=1 Tax=Saccharata proteae CBS 121410 TaxID=1314787 RepID=A0A9P4LXR1_9PEZI|nr:hypothetical protein K490DRAFT_56528 [Saccharata proteae CBS 121410]
MTRPNIIRADTIDLQAQSSPSAADHTRQPTQPAPLGIGPAAPHQAAAVRHVNAERNSEEIRLSAALDDLQDGDYANGDDEHHDEHATHMNGEQADASDDPDLADSETEDMDDDMLDKISSSPSIDDASHHHSGEYTRTEPEPGATASDHEIDEDDHEESRDTLGPLPGEQHEDEGLGQDVQDEGDTADLRIKGDASAETASLLPDDDSVAQDPVDPEDTAGHTPPTSRPASAAESDSADSWVTESDHASWNEEEEEDDDDSDDFSFSDDPRFVDSGWGGECLRETEDIDFEFVYALHTFVATVEGQANATKGDTMVLLDDSNSYWWLVRVVKDSSIEQGYLPAEHIETPTERLARLNKHRNIDLSATMLADTAEKTKNPLKKAMRRRNAKTVQFTAPTYVEASDYEWSSEEEDDAESEVFGNGDPHVDEVQDPEEHDDQITVEPLKVGSKEKKAAGAEPSGVDATVTEDGGRDSMDKSRASDELEPRISRNGTVRNTDSFFKDDSVETRKITLTPNILRDDSSSSTVRSTETRERAASLDSLEKDKPMDKGKDDKKKKEKKPGMLRGLFGRKDKKTKASDTEPSDEAGKPSDEISRESPQPKESMDESPVEKKAEKEVQQPQPQRQTSKSKQQKPPLDTSQAAMQTIAEERSPQSPTPQTPQSQQVVSPTSIVSPASANGANGTPRGLDSTMRLVQQSPVQNAAEQTAAVKSPTEAAAPEPLRARSNSSVKNNPITNMLRSNSEQKPDKMPREKTKKAKQRVQLDDFDSTPEDEVADPFADTNEDHQEGQQAARQPSHNDESPDMSSLEESQLPALVGDTSSQEDHDDSPVSPRPSSPIQGRGPSSNIAVPSSPTVPPNSPPLRSAPLPSQLDTDIPPAGPGSGVPSSARSLPAWSDASLRSYLDDGSDIRDMLVVVHDTSGVVPVGPEHPIMADLFKEERGKMKELSSQLDGLLGDWLGRKKRAKAASR